MKFKIDENLPVEASEVLRKADHDALTVHDQHMSGHSDNQIAMACQKEKRAIVSLDLDFADIRSYPPKDFSGLIVLRLKRQDKNHGLKMLFGVLKILSSESLDGTLWIVDENRIRIRQ